MTTSPLSRGLLLARTVRHLRPAQVAHRARLRGQRAAVRRFPGAAAARLRHPIPSRPGWPPAFVAMGAGIGTGYPDPAANTEGRFTFLQETRDLAGTAGWDWRQDRADQLWRFHLHYFDWAWPFATHPDRGWAQASFARLWRSWHNCSPFGQGDAWSPYVVAVRAWALCGLHGPLVAGSELEREYLASLALHAGFLRAHLELDVGGNHLVKNLKALVGLGVFLADDALLGRAWRRLEGQLGAQVLPDGGHFERSPSYHCQVLGDLIDVHGLLAAAGRRPSADLDAAVTSMRGWLGAMLLPDGDVPLFNDATLVGRSTLAALGPLPVVASRLTVLGPSGYIVVRAGRLHLVADVGQPCPPELPAHAHADCLSYELLVDGRRVVVDTGTSTYRSGPRRRYERSTRAHNTVEVDGADQTEVWATFRAARRAVPTLEHVVDADPVIVTASHDGYRRLRGRPVHRRTWTVAPASVDIVDEVGGAGAHRLVSAIHFGPDTAAAMVAPLTVRAGSLHVTVGGDVGSAELVPATVATDFGAVRPTMALEATAQGQLPLRIETRLALSARTGPA